LASGASFSTGYYDSRFGSNELSELRFSYRLPFFGGHGERIRTALADARFALQHEADRLELAALELKREVARRYHGVLLANDELRLAEQLAEIGEQRLAATRIRLEGDQASRLDLRQAQINGLRARHRLTKAAQQQTSAVADLKLVIGAALDETVRVDDDLTTDGGRSLADLPLDALVMHAERERLELAVARRGLARLEQQIESERRNFLPNVEVSLQYSLISEDDPLGGATSFDDGRFGIGLKMNTDFNRSERRSQRQRRLLELDHRRRELVRALDLVALEIRDGRATVLNRRAEVELAAQMTELAREERARGELLAEGGQLDQLALLGLDQDLSEARHQQRAAEIALIAADHDLRLAVGGSL